MFTLGLLSVVASIAFTHRIERRAFHRRNGNGVAAQSCTAQVTDVALEALGRLICVVTAVIGVIMIIAAQKGLGA